MDGRETSGTATLHVVDSTNMQESYLDGSKTTPIASSREVDVYTVSDVVRQCRVPPQFGVLSLDVEGVGCAVARSWLSDGYRPRWIVYEWLHEDGGSCGLALRNFSYRHVVRLGWNDIYELEGIDASGFDKAR